MTSATPQTMGTSVPEMATTLAAATTAGEHRPSLLHHLTTRWRRSGKSPTRPSRPSRRRDSKARRTSRRLVDCQILQHAKSRGRRLGHLLWRRRTTQSSTDRSKELVVVYLVLSVPLRALRQPRQFLERLWGHSRGRWIRMVGHAVAPQNVSALRAQSVDVGPFGRLSQQ